MHVVIDAHLAVKKIDGISRYLNRLLTELPSVDKSNQFTLLTSKGRETGLSDSVLKNENVRKIEMDLVGPNPRQHWVIPKMLKGLKADIYHHPQYDLPRGIPVPAVVTIHDLKYIHHPEFLRKINWFKSYYIKKSLRFSLKSASQIIAVSQNTLDDLLRFTSFDRGKASVVYHGIDEPAEISSENAETVLSQYGIPKDYCLFVGTRRPHKNILGLIRAFAILRREHEMSDLNLVVVGKQYSDYLEPEKLADELGMTPYIRFLDFVPDEDLNALYQGARIFVLTSLYEGFGFPLLEAMSYGTPVIGSNVSSIPEIIGEAGLLADPASPEDIAEKCLFALTNIELRDKLKMAGLERVKRFNWTVVAEATLDIYKLAAGVSDA